MKLEEQKLLVLDGACGTSIQNMEIPSEVWGGREGCNEYLCLRAPGMITAMHLDFLEAGADIVETNSFGANAMVLEEYGLQDKVMEINRAAVVCARKAVDAHGSGWVGASVGPGTKLPSLGHIGVEELAGIYSRQFQALIAAGADLLILETAQDILHLKTILITAFEAMETLGKEIPVMVSVTIENSGTMLVGTDIAAAAAILEAFPIFSLGLNCATGPRDMLSSIRWLSHNWPGRISCLPNQGLPEIVGGETVYPLVPEEFAREMTGFVRDWGVSLVGGCCGSTASHIKELKKSLAGILPAERKIAL